MTNPIRCALAVLLMSTWGLGCHDDTPNEPDSGTSDSGTPDADLLQHLPGWDMTRSGALYVGAIGIRVPGDGYVYLVDITRGLLIFREP